MIADEAIFETAHGLLKILGEQAAMECAEMADSWAKRGDVEASEIWKRVMAAVRKLQGAQPT